MAWLYELEGSEGGGRGGAHVLPSHLTAFFIFFFLLCFNFFL